MKTYKIENLSKILFIIINFFSIFIFGKIILQNDFHCGYNLLHTTEIYNSDFEKRSWNTPSASNNQPFSLTLNFQDNSLQSQFESERNQLIRASQVWEEILHSTPISINIDVDFASLGENTLGQSTITSTFIQFDDFINALQKKNGNRYPLYSEFRAIFQNDGDALFDNYVSVPTSIARNLGMFNFTTRDGFITFSSDFNFDADLSDGITKNSSDFLTVAIHEIGHILGFTSSVDTFDNLPGPSKTRLNPLDLHRFFSSTIDFISSPRLLDPSKNPHRFFDGNRNGQTSNQIAFFSRGKNQPPLYDQASHWLDDNNQASQFIGIMDPVLNSGQINGFSPVDEIAFQELGYNVTPLPSPIIYGILDSISNSNTNASVLTFADSGTIITIIGQLFRSNVMCLFGNELVLGNLTIESRFSQIQCTIGNSSSNFVQVTNDGISFSNALPLIINGGSPSCGNGTIEILNEECDDNNTITGDGCSNNCFIETGFNCNFEPSICFPICGDGIIRFPEICDDGNTFSGDGCNQNCSQIEWGFSCSDKPSICSPICGDGLIISPENCDDNNTIWGDGCDQNCTTEAGFFCSGEPSNCTDIILFCGDGIINFNEECDDDNTITGDGCSNNCFIETGFNCSFEPSICFPICGDGIIRFPEKCDDGNTFSGDGCDQNCSQIEWRFSCSDEPSICSPICGDGLIFFPENCDDNNTIWGDGCDQNCTTEAGFFCSGEPSNCTDIILFCGDGIINFNEECDSGNKLTRGCIDCQISPGWICFGSNPSICSEDCGDGITTYSELCDDGNRISNDGCSSLCKIEEGYECVLSNSSLSNCSLIISSSSSSSDLAIFIAVPLSFFGYLLFFLLIAAFFYFFRKSERSQDLPIISEGSEEEHNFNYNP